MQNSNALGNAPGNATQGCVVVTAGAALELQGNGLVINKSTLSISGVGYRNMQVTPTNSGCFSGGSGGLRNIGGNNTVTGNIILAGPTFVNGGDSGSTLYLTGCTSDAENLTKIGSGNVELGGTIANTYSGTTFVDEGNLVLNKATGACAVAGPLVIGDLRGTAQVVYAHAATNPRRSVGRRGRHGPGDGRAANLNGACVTLGSTLAQAPATPARPDPDRRRLPGVGRHAVDPRHARHFRQQSGGPHQPSS